MTPDSPARYEDRLDAFIGGLGGDGGRPVAIFHAVRNIPYASRGSRRPDDVLDAKEGSCSGKHLLLRDLLRRAGETADVETVEGDFAGGLPEAPSMPATLRAMVHDGGVRDFHQYVVWAGPGGEMRLDATWPDYVSPHGVATNAGWDGRGDTQIALKPTRVVGRAEDLIAYKERLLATLSAEETVRRREFLSLLTQWLEKLRETGGHDE